MLHLGLGTGAGWPSRRQGGFDSKKFACNRVLVEPDCMRFDEWLEHVYWALLRDPASGQRVSEIIWKLDMSLRSSGDSKLTLYYAFNEERIVLMDVRAEPLGKS